jgi:hypothetical protein
MPPGARVRIGIKRVDRVQRVAVSPHHRHPGGAMSFLSLTVSAFLVVAGYRRGEADVMQKAVAVIEAEQQRADHGFALIVPEAASHQRPDPPV